MTIRQSTSRSVFRAVYSGMTETVCLLKRENDQRAGIFRSIPLYGVKWENTMKTGEPLQGSMTSSHHRIIFIEKKRLQAVGVQYINHLDRFRDKEGRHWQSESTERIDITLFENVCEISCLRCDPGVPPNQVL